ncbi:ABC transporter ATP-binding protein [Halopenitus persicus]|uniref:Probable branched-chain amino acid transport ATP-binding protein LivG n=1 Tax=Halopenitus persicus TaxID=1048396 RepID=A0A1H3LV98_9EURY|nr:ABC transporter ATP-binding protein [Halopenitus persicus]SDY67928.1 amino acid/amide ABC transporter ATP-binding protein 1, HAAT family [Halopenitus persicus]
MVPPTTDGGEYVRPDAETVLRVEGVEKTFGGVTALDGVDLEVRDGEIVGLVGPNGAGKTTLFNCIMGEHDVDAGSVHLGDTELTGMNTPDIVQAGLSRMFQLARVFPELTVRENVLINQDHSGETMLTTLFRETDEEVVRRAEELIEFVDLTHLIDEQAGNLSGGQKKLLNLACTLLSEPDVVLLDEPTAGVNPNLVDDITESITELNRDRGTTFLVIEHDMDVVHEISDHVYVFATATNLTDGEPNAALNDPRVLEAYFGE